MSLRNPTATRSPGSFDLFARGPGANARFFFLMIGLDLKQVCHTFADIIVNFTPGAELLVAAIKELAPIFRVADLDHHIITPPLRPENGRA